MNVLTYTQLDPSRKQIRLLKLEPASDEVGPIKGELSIHSLDDGCPPYTAISYVWGDPGDIRDICIGGCTLPATGNLVAFLTQYKILIYEKLWETEPYTAFDYIWIDAICIDQTNLSERSSQVAMMGQVYKRCAATICWLGVEANGSDLAMGILNDLALRINRAEIERQAFKPADLLPDLTHSRRARGYAGPWKAVQLLLQRPYWKRVWTFQEMALPLRAQVFCGSSFCDLPCIVDCNRWITDVTNSSQPNCFDNPTWEFLVVNIAPIATSAIRPQFFRTLIQQINYSTLPNDGHTLTRWNFVIADLIFKLHDLQAQDDRDRIYGLLGIAPLRLIPDYTKSADDVFLEFASIFMQNGGLNMLLSRAGHSRRSYDSRCPAWVPRWGQQHPMSDLFLPNVYNERPSEILDNFRFNVSGTLLLSGVKLDKILSIWTLNDPKQLYGPARDIFEQCKPAKPYPSGGTNLEALFRTFLRNVDPGNPSYLLPSHPSSEKQEGYHLRVFGQLLEYFFHYGYDNDEPTVSAYQSRQETFGMPADHHFGVRFAQLLGLSSQTLEVLRGVSAATITQIATTERRVDEELFILSAVHQNLFVTSSGLFGIGTPRTQVGDEVVVTEQCHNPMVLRSNSESYDFVCAAYVHGHMAQEALSSMSRRKSFTIK